MGTYVAIQGYLSNLPQWKVLVRPDFGHIKDIPSVFFRLFRLHDLDIDVPNGVIAPFDSFKQILNEKVGVLATDFDGFFSGEVANANGGLDVYFDIFEVTVLDDATC